MKKRSIVASALAALIGVTALLVTACGEKDVAFNNSKEWLTKGETIPTKNVVLPENVSLTDNVAVHDPSVFFDPIGKKYYSFGSHFAVASSTDLISWTQECGENPMTLYGTADFRSVLKKSDEFVGNPSGDINSTWAPDVERIEGRYYMYYSLTEKFGSGKSVIGRVSSSNVMGPYADEEVIVKSNNMNGEPNCIDPELFYDKNGGLWMVYGSFYGGIYILELENKGDRAGLPKEIEGQTNGGFGKLLWKGGGGGVEGPFVFYSAETEYYYLMVSDGDLNTNYNMRVARSENPDGPYKDIQGNNVADTLGAGNKLAGNFQFAGETSQYALGHNSVIKKDGKYLAVYHTRFAPKSYHKLRTSQIFFNKEGWPVLSPERFVGEEKGLVTEEQIAGDYDIVVHSTGRNADTLVQSEKYTLTADKKVLNASGAEVGTWALSDGYYVSLTLNDVSYSGVAAPIWRAAKSKGTLAVTATSTTGGSLWAKGV